MPSKKTWSSPNPSNSEPKFHGTPIIEDRHGKTLRPITRGQQDLLEAIERNDIVFVNGPAGTGKSVISTWIGIAGIDAGEYEHLVLTRPIVEAGEELGFLPGTFEEKVAPYMQPLYEAIEVVKGKRVMPEHAKPEQPVPPSKYKIKKGVDFKASRKPEPTKAIPSPNDDFYKKVNVCPLAYLRGTTKSRSFIILDESQNVTSVQMKMMLTRLGYGSKLVVCGDINQSDLDGRAKSGFREAQQILKGVKGIGFITLGIDDIVRHKLIKDIIIRYEQKNNKSKGDVYSNREFIENERDLRNYDFDEEPEEKEDDTEPEIDEKDDELETK